MEYRQVSGTVAAVLYCKLNFLGFVLYYIYLVLASRPYSDCRERLLLISHVFRGVYSIISMKQLASSEKLGGGVVFLHALRGGIDATACIVYLLCV